jgi:hypothetical protein
MGILYSEILTSDIPPEQITYSKVFNLWSHTHNFMQKGKENSVNA